MFGFLKQALSETDGTPSSKRLVYFLVIVSVIGLCWYIVVKYGIIEQLVTMINSLIYSSSAAYGVGRSMENSSALNNFGNPGVPSPKISDVMVKKFASEMLPQKPNVESDMDEEDLGISPKGD